MAIDRLDGTFVIKTRSEIVADALRDTKYAAPDADVGPGTQPYIDAKNTADIIAPIYALASRVANAISLEDAQGEDLDAWGLRSPGQRDRKGQTSALGYIVLRASAGGPWPINAGQELVYEPTSAAYLVIATGPYLDGDIVAVQAKAAGPTANLAPGALLKWTSPPTGILSSASVFENANGSGITGGAEAENDDDYWRVLFDRFANPPGNGNAAAYVAAVEDVPGIAIQKAYCYPAILGPGTTALAFTMRPSAPGASRLPNGAQLAEVEAWVKDAFPGDDGIFTCSGADDLVSVGLEVTWKVGAAGWADTSPWPVSYADPVHVTDAVAITSASFRVTSASTISAPVPGQTIGLYDSTSRGWKRKRIASVVEEVAGTTYTLTFDTATAGATDTYVPTNGALVSPWSDSLADIVTPVLTYIDGQGPGEMVASFGDPELRQRRAPAPAPEAWANRIENRIVDGLFSVVGDAEVVFPAVPDATAIGTPGALWYLHRLGDLAVYPQ